MQQQREKSKLRWYKIAGTVVLAILLLLGGVRLFLNTDLARSWVKKSIIGYSDSYIEGTLQIEQLEGDLWNTFRMVNVGWSDETGDSVARLDTLALRYDLPTLLFADQFRISALRLKNPRLSLKRDSDGQWNMTTLIKPGNQSDTSAASSFFVRVDTIEVSGGEADIQPSASHPDSVYKLRDFGLGAEAGYDREGYRAQIRELQFTIGVPFMTDAVQLQSSGKYRQKSFSLDKLMISTGQSLFSSQMNVDLTKKTIDIGAFLKPLARQDVNSVVTPSPIKQDLQAGLFVEGTLSDFTVGLNLQAKALDHFNLEADFTWDSLLVARGLRMDVRELDGPQLVDSALVLPQIGVFHAEVDGYFPMQDWASADLKGELNGQRISYQHYRINNFTSSLQYSRHGGQLKADLEREKEHTRLKLHGQNLFDSLKTPEWKAQVNAQNLDPAHWFNDPTARGSINVNVNARGSGWSPKAESWNLNLKVEDSRLGGQKISMMDLQSRVYGDSIKTRAELLLGQSLVQANTSLNDYQANPRYEFHIHSQNFNLGDINGLEPNRSHFKIDIEGRGQGVTTENLQLTSNIAFDSSSINGARIDQMHGTMQIEDEVIKIKDAVLKSELASGTFTARQHLTRYYDPRNNLDINLELLNVQPLAPFFNANQLAALGTIVGDIRPTVDDDLVFEGTLDLHDVRYNDLLNIESVDGNAYIKLLRDPTYQLEMDIENPEVASVVLQDFSLKAGGRVVNQSSNGSFELRFRSGTGAEMVQRASYNLQSDSLQVRTQQLKLNTPESKLQLTQPFEIRYGRGHWSIDTLRLAGKDGTYLELVAPGIDSLNQVMSLRGHAINMQEVQQTLLNKSYVKGIFSGKVFLEKHGQDVEMASDIQLSGLAYRKLQLDTLFLNAAIKENRFDMATRVQKGGDEIVAGAVELPFRLGDPEKFPDSFYRQEVQGYLQVNPVSVETMEGINDLLGLQQTKGKLQMRGVLRGEAGNPIVTGYAIMSNGTWSGVPIDSATVEIDYRHDLQNMEVVADIISLGQKAMDLKAQLPVNIDLRGWSVSVPPSSDSLKAYAQTRNFNLSALNDFLESRTIRNIKGRIDGEVNVDGTVKDPDARGYIVLNDAEATLPETGVTYGKMQGKLEFEDDQINLKGFQVRNGGSFNASGNLEFDGRNPVGMNLDIKAQHFEAANTRDLRLIINSKAKLKGPFTSPTVTGQLTLARGFYDLQNFGAKTVETVRLDSVETTYMAEDLSLYDSLKAEMTLEFNPEFKVRNRRYADLEVGLQGELDVLKEKKDDLQLFGAIAGKNGYIQTLGKRFTMEEAQMQFAGNPSDPRLQMRFSYRPPKSKEDIIIYYIVTGTLQDPEFRYESQPEMELENIVSYTLFGQPYYALDSWKQMVASPGGGGGATNLLTEALLNRVESLATRKLGIDVVQIENNLGGAGGGTIVKTGWYLSEKVFFAILNELSGGNPNTIFMLEYMLNNNLELILTQGNDTREGIDLHWQKDY